MESGLNRVSPSEFSASLNGFIRTNIQERDWGSRSARELWSVMAGEFGQSPARIRELHSFSRSRKRAKNNRRHSANSDCDTRLTRRHADRGLDRDAVARDACWDLRIDLQEAGYFAGRGSRV